MNLSVRQKIAFSTITVVLLTGIIFYWVIFPTVKEIQAINQAIYLERLDLEKKYLRGQLLNKALEDFEKTMAQKDALVSVFIFEGDELSFVTDLEAIAERFDIRQDLKLTSTTKKNFFYLPTKLSINAQGQFENVLDYLTTIDQLDYYFNISSLSITGQSSEADAAVVVKLEGEIYIIPTEEQGNI